MAVTFGGGTGDDINLAGASTIANLTTLVVAGWWYPTTLTAGNGLWSVGNVAGCKIHTTTSELQLITDNTTDGLITTSGLGLVTNTWQFLAFLGSFTNTGPAEAWRVWKGNSTAPVEIGTVVTTAPVGNFTGNATWYIGNLGTGTVAFQGDIASVVFIHGAGMLLSGTTTGTLSQDDADLVLRDSVWPLWLGDIAKMETADSSRPHFFMELANSTQAAYGRPNATDPTWAAGANGATVSANGNPRPPISRPAWPLRRR